jgi:hypothetical protein
VRQNRIVKVQTDEEEPEWFQALQTYARDAHESNGLPYDGTAHMAIDIYPDGSHEVRFFISGPPPKEQEPPIIV